MILARVTGSIVSTVKSERFRNGKLLIVRGTDSEGNVRGGEDVALDPGLDAGIGDLVLIAKEGDVVKQLLDTDALPGTPGTPANVVIIAVVDEIDDSRRTQ
ncbi:EutN/CcmL family microcompartment protein [soil metagenome]